MCLLFSTAVLPECSAGESPCRSGICVPNTVFCDGYDDCGDLSDEVDVTCQPGGY